MASFWCFGCVTAASIGHVRGSGLPPMSALDWGKAFQTPDVNTWPGVEVPYGCGTDTNMPQLPSLLDRTLHWTVDLSKVGCRNVLAFQAVDASVNDGCYCDGNSLQSRDDDPYSPGNCRGPLNTEHQPCVELDFMEANRYVWATTVHAGGVPGGWKEGHAGGHGAQRIGMTSAQYGPGSEVIDTNHPFQVSMHFPTDGSSLHGINVTLTQTEQVQFWVGQGDDLSEVYAALQRGVTPGFSYWSNAEGMDWYDADDCQDAQAQSEPSYYYEWGLTEGTHHFIAEPAKVFASVV